ncbi:MAG: glycosyltransferase [Acidobacteriota bacterium]
MDWKTDRIEKAVVLKAPAGPRERGVVLVSFEYQWARLMGVQNLQEFARSYLLVTAPTWSPPHALENTLFPAQYPDDRIVTLISNQQDCLIFPALSPKFQVAPLYASSWVNSDLYQPVPFAEKDIDIVVLANFGTYKRHFALFEALRQLPEHLRVVLVGQPVEGRTSKALLAEADLYGVRNRLELRESVTDAVVVDTLRRSKISLILSMQEGSCVAVAEALIANTPTGVMEDAIVGSKAFISSRDRTSAAASRTRTTTYRIPASRSVTATA